MVIVIVIVIKNSNSNSNSTERPASSAAPIARTAASPSDDDWASQDPRATAFLALRVARPGALDSVGSHCAFRAKIFSRWTPGIIVPLVVLDCPEVKCNSPGNNMYDDHRPPKGDPRRRI